MEWISPSIDGGGHLSATIGNQDCVAASNTDLLYPAIAVNHAGNGLISFSVNGGQYYPRLG
jgi:hypothetical protein